MILWVLGGTASPVVTAKIGRLKIKKSDRNSWLVFMADGR
jgi:hypothetical protein